MNPGLTAACVTVALGLLGIIAGKGPDPDTLDRILLAVGILLVGIGGTYGLALIAIGQIS